MKEVVLTNGQGLVALIDDSDFEAVSAYRWRLRKLSHTSYAVRSLPNGRQITLHRFLLGLSALHIDHIDHNGLNNQRSNLRFVTHQQNCFNRKKLANSSSQYKGVYWHKASQQWEAKIIFNKKPISLGYFFSEKNAGLAYDEAAKKYFGEFAHLNFQEAA